MTLSWKWHFGGSLRLNGLCFGRCGSQGCNTFRTLGGSCMYATAVHREAGILHGNRILRSRALPGGEAGRAGRVSGGVGEFFPRPTLIEPHSSGGDLAQWHGSLARLENVPSKGLGVPAEDVLEVHSFHAWTRVITRQQSHRSTGWGNRIVPSERGRTLSLRGQGAALPAGPIRPRAAGQPPKPRRHTGNG